MSAPDIAERRRLAAAAAEARAGPSSSLSLLVPPPTSSADQEGARDPRRTTTHDKDPMDLTCDEPARVRPHAARATATVDLTHDDEALAQALANLCNRCERRPANAGHALCSQCFQEFRARHAAACAICHASPPNPGFRWCQRCFDAVRRPPPQAGAPFPHHDGGALAGQPREDASYEELLALDENVVSQGLSHHQMRSLATRSFLGARDALMRTGEAACAICQSEYEEGDELALLPCSHSYHKQCVATWLRDKPTCPACQRDVRQDLRA